MSEKNAYLRLKERVSRPSDRWDRVENGIVVGMPDVNYCILGTEGWVEIKSPEEPARPTTSLFGSNHQVSVDQCNWMLRQANAGGISWLFIVTRQRLMLLPGQRVGKMGILINKLRVNELEDMAAWRTLNPVMDPLRWADLREALSAR